MSVIFEPAWAVRTRHAQIPDRAQGKYKMDRLRQPDAAMFADVQRLRVRRAVMVLLPTRRG